ncbi:TRAM domain-containing protein [Candidatus Woesearchaeota archaeon]|nr:MAG: deoxyribonuclease/rho motif-related tram [archaeon GW2011_AR18]MBS3161564.1 TRAM domain-containing protein [Candidatus Woesearchaeota archaeon]HIH25659.1 TRAM domain-containing protein [Nanoarchaeota archaeon]
MENRRSFAPVQVGEELNVTIEAVGEKGDGVAKVKGFVLFVANTKQGDNVRVKVTKVFKKVGFAEVVGAATADSNESSSESTEESEESEESEEDYKSEEP